MRQNFFFCCWHTKDMLDHSDNRLSFSQSSHKVGVRPKVTQGPVT